MTKKVSGLRCAIGAGSRGPMGKGRLVNPAHTKPPQASRQGVTPALYRDK